MKVSELTFDEGNASKMFKLGDGHGYLLHRIVREGKPTLYSLFGTDQMQVVSPYINEPMMDGVLHRRGGATEAVDEWISKTGLICPGCGAEVTKDGTHFPPEDGEAPPPAPPLNEVQCGHCGEYDGKHEEFCTPEYRHRQENNEAKRSKSRFLK